MKSKIDEFYDDFAFMTEVVEIDGVIYTHRCDPEIWIRFTGEGWEEVDDPKQKNPKRLSKKEAYDKFHFYSPKQKMIEIETARLQKAHDELMELAKTTPRRVIGWFYRPYGQLEEINKRDPEAYAAIVKDVMDHHYLCSGEEYQDDELEPVLDNYKFVSFTQRGFAQLMADADGLVQPHASTMYTQREFIMKSHTPSSGIYPDVKEASHEIEIPQAFFDVANELMDTESDESLCYSCPVPMPREGVYYLGQTLLLETQNMGDFEFFEIKGIRLIQNKKEYIEYIKFLRKETKDASHKDEDCPRMWYTHMPEFGFEKPFLVLEFLLTGPDYF